MHSTSHKHLVSYITVGSSPPPPLGPRSLPHSLSSSRLVFFYSATSYFAILRHDSFFKHGSSTLHHMLLPVNNRRRGTMSLHPLIQLQNWLQTRLIRRIAGLLFIIILLPSFFLKFYPALASAHGIDIR